MLRSASEIVPYVVVARNRLVRCSRPHGSPRKPECSLTPSMATGCSDCSSNARIPPTNIEVSAWIRQIASSAVNQRGPGVYQIRRWADSNSGPAIRIRTAPASVARPRSSSSAGPSDMHRSLCASVP